MTLKAGLIFSVLCVLMLTGCGSSEPEYLTVDEVVQHADELMGQEIRVRGEIYGISENTDGGCPPDNCSCNSGFTSLYLANEVGSPSILFAHCEGYSCGYWCLELPFTVSQPGEPHVALGGLELVGTLNDCQESWLCLVDIDVNESSLLSGDGELTSMERTPMPSGEYDFFTLER